jgi:hypothetical protein
MEPQDAKKNVETRDGKKPYRKPRLETLGTVRELTLGGGGTKPDGFQKNHT